MSFTPSSDWKRQLRVEFSAPICSGKCIQFGFPARTGKRYAKYQKEVEKEEKKSKKYKTICLQAKCIKTHGAAHGQPDAWTDMNNISLAFLLCLAMGKAKLGMARAAAAAGSEKTKTVAKTCHIKCTDSGNRKSMGLECFYCCRNSAGIRFEVDACMWLLTLLFFLQLALF